MLAKRSSGGENSSYTLTITRWEPQSGNADIDVDGRLYDRVEEGGHVCIFLHPGLLDWRWYEAGLCR